MIYLLFSRYTVGVKMEEKIIKEELDSLKQSVNDWILFLDGNQRQTKSYIRDLERRIRQLEMRVRIT